MDISLGRDGYRTVPLRGVSYMAAGGQSDPACWADTVAACDSLLARFIAADPVGMLNALQAELQANGMLRNGDDRRHAALVAYLEGRLEALPTELGLNRDQPYFPVCETGLVLCGEACVAPCERAPRSEPLPNGGVRGGSDAGAQTPAVPDIAVPEPPIVGPDPGPEPGPACALPPTVNHQSSPS